jgi:hypothetical protein
MNKSTIQINNEKISKSFEVSNIHSYQDLKRILDLFFIEGTKITISTMNSFPERDMFLIFNSELGSLVSEQNLSAGWFFIQVLKGECRYSGCKK